MPIDMQGPSPLLSVFDMPTPLRFYRPPAPDPSRIAAHGDTQIYIGCQDLDTASLYLRASSVAVKGPMVRPFGIKQLFSKDPDGYELCLQWSA